MARLTVKDRLDQRGFARKTGLFLISMGVGAAGHAQYLIADDVLGLNHPPGLCRFRGRI